MEAEYGDGNQPAHLTHVDSVTFTAADGSVEEIELRPAVADGGEQMAIYWDSTGTFEVEL